MSVEFRQRSVGEILGMFRRRVWYILLPTLAVGLAVAWVVWKLPNIYESRTVLTVKPPTISQSVVRPLTEEDLSQPQLDEETLPREAREGAPEIRADEAQQPGTIGGRQIEAGGVQEDQAADPVGRIGGGKPTLICAEARRNTGAVRNCLTSFSDTAAPGGCDNPPGPRWDTSSCRRTATTFLFVVSWAQPGDCRLGELGA